MATLHLSRWMFVAAALVGALRPVGVDGVSAIDSGTLPLPTRLHKTGKICIKFKVTILRIKPEIVDNVASRVETA